jgi:hypothetical protein
VGHRHNPEARCLDVHLGGPIFLVVDPSRRLAAGGNLGLLGLRRK